MIVSVIIDTRRMSAKGFPIKFSLYSGREYAYISTGVYVRDTDKWVGDPVSGNYVKSNLAGAKVINSVLSAKYNNIIAKVVEMEKSVDVESMSAKEIKDYLSSDKKKEDAKPKNPFYPYAEDYLRFVRTEKSVELYRYTFARMRQFCEKELTFEDINAKYLYDFDRWMELQGNSANTRAIHMANIRAIYNRAIDEDVVGIGSYPFRKYRVKKHKKEKECLTDDELVSILTADVSGQYERARDLFALSFWLCGVNPIDIWHMPPSTDGKIHYKRTKIKKHEPDTVHITIPDEALRIIEKHKGTNFLVDYAETFRSYRGHYSVMRRDLHVLGERLGIKRLIYYHARYTWATIAAKLGVPDNVIGKALGHTDVSMAMSRYISFDWSLVDEANKKVAHHVWQATEKRKTK